MILKKNTLSLATGLLLSSVLTTAGAATLSASVTENGKAQLGNAVVYAVPENGLSVAEKNAGKQIIDQIDKEFVPHVSVIQAGTSVDFPNHDKIRHHVYSFSPAKSFEIPLYKGTPAEPIKFEQPGVVKLGCNIHDWMAASVFITETPYFGVSDASGNVVLDNLPAGSYSVFVWHPQQTAETGSTAQQVALNDAGTQTVSFTVKKKKQWIPFRAPTSASGSY
jgi:plastocyanin